jgi:hypothetical protein
MPDPRKLGFSKCAKKGEQYFLNKMKKINVTFHRGNGIIPTCRYAELITIISMYISISHFNYMSSPK